MGGTLGPEAGCGTVVQSISSMVTSDFCTVDMVLVLGASHSAIGWQWHVGHHPDGNNSGGCECGGGSNCKCGTKCGECGGTKKLRHWLEWQSMPIPYGRSFIISSDWIRRGPQSPRYVNWCAQYKCPTPKEQLLFQE